MIGSSDMFGFPDSGQPVLRDQWGGVTVPGSIFTGGTFPAASVTPTYAGAGSVVLPGGGSTLYIPFTSGKYQIALGDVNNGFCGITGANNQFFFLGSNPAGSVTARVSTQFTTAAAGGFQWSNDSNANSGTYDLGLARAATGSISVTDNVNGKAIGISMLTELLTIAAAATSTTAIQKPANSIVLGVSVRNTVAVTCTSTYTVGDSTSAARFSTVAVSKVVNTTDPGTKAGAYYNATAEGIIITPDSTPSDATGRVRVTIYYILVTPPTS